MKTPLLVAWAAAAILAVACSEETPAAGNASSSSSSGGDPEPAKDAGPTSKVVCVTRGGKILTTLPSCDVSFASDVIPALAAAGCGDADCHGAGATARPPKLDLDDAAGTYEVLSQFTPRSRKPYINPCSTKPADAVMDDNLDPDAPAADRGALMPPNTGLPDAVDTVREWLACGSPDN